MRRYLTSWALSNFKKSLKSCGSRIVAIQNAPHQLQRGQTVRRTSRKPIRFFIGRVGQTADREHLSIDLYIKHLVHLA